MGPPWPRHRRARDAARGRVRCAQSKFRVKNVDELLRAVNGCVDGVAFSDLADAYLRVKDDLDVGRAQRSAPACVWVGGLWVFVSVWLVHGVPL